MYTFRTCININLAPNKEIEQKNNCNCKDLRSQFDRSFFFGENIFVDQGIIFKEENMRQLFGLFFFSNAGIL